MVVCIVNQSRDRLRVMRTALGAFWASWADALPMLLQRWPRLTGQFVHHLSHPDAPGCWGELQESVSELDRDGFVVCPCWEMLRRGVLPRLPLIVEPGEWHHGWQYYSSSSSEHHFRGLYLPSRVLPTRPICDHTLGDCAHQTVFGRQ